MKFNKLFTGCMLFAVPGLAMAILISGVDHKIRHQHPYFDEIDFSGYSYGSYNYLVRSRRLTSGVYNRAFDLATSGFRLHQAYLQADSSPKYGVGGFANVLVGSDAVLNAPQGMNPQVFNLRNFGLSTPEAYLKFNYGATQLHAGLIISLSGLESFVFTEDTNFSRSILDNYAQPGSHIGLRLIHKLSKEWKLVFGTVNSWSSVMEAGQQNGIEAGVDYHVANQFELNVNFFNVNSYVNSSATSGAFGRRSLIDIFGTYHVTDKLQLAWNLDYGWQTKAELPTTQINEAIWKGVDGYINYQFNDQWRTSFRAEVYDDGEGYTTGVRQAWKEMTLTFAYKPIKNLELFAETRHDFSSTAAFVNQGGNGANNNQQSFALAALYVFA